MFWRLTWYVAKASVRSSFDGILTLWSVNSKTLATKLHKRLLWDRSTSTHWVPHWLLFLISWPIFPCVVWRFYWIFIIFLALVRLEAPFLILGHLPVLLLYAHVVCCLTFLLVIYCISGPGAAGSAFPDTGSPASVAIVCPCPYLSPCISPSSNGIISACVPI